MEVLAIYAKDAKDYCISPFLSFVRQHLLPQTHLFTKRRFTTSWSSVEQTDKKEDVSHNLLPVQEEVERTGNRSFFPLVHLISVDPLHSKVLHLSTLSSSLRRLHDSF